MNMYKEVSESLVSFSSEDDNLTAEYCFAKNREVFKGHFPEMPILPGVMQLEMVRQIAEKSTGLKLRISNLRKVKFMEQVMPEDRITLSVKLKDHDDILDLTAVLKVETKTVGKINFELIKQK